MLQGVNQDRESTPLAAVLALTFVCSMGTGVLWHAVPFIAKHSYDFLHPIVGNAGLQSGGDGHRTGQ